MVAFCKEFATDQLCTRLALLLNIDGAKTFVESLRQRSPRMSSEEIAFRLLKTWKREKGSAIASTEKLLVVMDTGLKFDSTALSALRSRLLACQQPTADPAEKG